MRRRRNRPHSKKDQSMSVPVGPQVPSGSLGALIWPLVMIALGVLAAGVGLWMLRRHPSEETQRAAASTTEGSGRSEAPKVATAGFHQILADPSFGGWPITGDFPLCTSRTRRSGQEEVAA